MVTVCVNLGDHVKEFVVFVTISFSSEWDIFVLTHFPLLKGTHDLKNIIVLVMLNMLVVEYTQHSIPNSWQDQELIGQIHLGSADPSSSSGSRTPKSRSQWLCAEHFLYAPSVIQMCKQ